MSLNQPHVLLAVAIAVGTILLGLWMSGGLAAALAGAGLADLALTYVERRRRTDLLEVRTERR